MTQSPFVSDRSKSDAKAYADALGYLFDRLDFERLSSDTSRYSFRLNRMFALARQLGLGAYLCDAGENQAADRFNAPVPEGRSGVETGSALPLIHIAGTKGKGSTGTMVSAILASAGMKTGLYSSPHLRDLEERFRVNGIPCLRDDVIALVDQIRPVVDRLVASDEIAEPSFFEVTTAMALLHFQQVQCDAMVLEVGLGGRLDSTNVCHPSVTAITSIGLDHQNVLGNTVAEIANEKAGIIKEGVPVVSGVRDGDAAEVIAEVAQRHRAPLFQIGRDFDVESHPDDRWGSKVTFRGNGPLRESATFKLGLEGRHQPINAAVAIACVDLVCDSKAGPATSLVRVGQEDSLDCLSDVQCACRVERFDLADDVMVIVDGAHNADSVAALCDCVRTRLDGRHVQVVFGTSRDKNARPMIEQLSQVVDRLVLTRFHGNPRFRAVPDLAELVPDSYRGEVKQQEDPIVACQNAIDLARSERRNGQGGVVVICGSFFLAAETRSWVAEQASFRS